MDLEKNNLKLKH